MGVANSRFAARGLADRNPSRVFIGFNQENRPVGYQLMGSYGPIAAGRTVAIFAWRFRVTRRTAAATAALNYVGMRHSIGAAEQMMATLSSLDNAIGSRESVNGGGPLHYFAGETINAERDDFSTGGTSDIEGEIYGVEYDA